AELLADRREDEVGGCVRDLLRVAEAEASPTEAPGGEAEETLHELAALAVRVAQRVDPGLAPRLHVAERLVGDERGREEENDCKERIGGAVGRDVEHHPAQSEQ